MSFECRILAFQCRRFRCLWVTSWHPLGRATPIYRRCTSKEQLPSFTINMELVIIVYWKSRLLLLRIGDPFVLWGSSRRYCVWRGCSNRYCWLVMAEYPGSSLGRGSFPSKGLRSNSRNLRWHVSQANHRSLMMSTRRYRVWRLLAVRASHSMRLARWSLCRVQGGSHSYQWLCLLLRSSTFSYARNHRLSFYMTFAGDMHHRWRLSSFKYYEHGT